MLGMVPVRKEDRHLLTSIKNFGHYRYQKAPKVFKASIDGYTHRYNHKISGVPRKQKLWMTLLCGIL